MVQIRPEEITQILKGQLAEFDKKLDISEVGTVVTVGDGVAKIYGLEKAMSGELVDFGNQSGTKFFISASPFFALKASDPMEQDDLQGRVLGHVTDFFFPRLVNKFRMAFFLWDRKRSACPTFFSLTVTS